VLKKKKKKKTENRKVRGPWTENDPLQMTPKAQITKEKVDKLFDFIKMKTTINRVKTTHGMREKLFSSPFI
jgi:hypothetical protein